MPSAARRTLLGGRAVADVDGDHAGAVEQRFGRALDDEAAGIDHHDVIADLLHVVEQVGGHQHGDAERAEPGDEVEHLLAAERVEAGGGLVEQHELRIADERLGQLGPLAHAGGEPADRAEAGLVETDQVEHVGRPLAGRLGREPTELAEGGDHIGCRLVEGQAVVLGHVAEARADADRVVGHRDPADLDGALRRPGQAEEDAEQRGLAGAVGTDDADRPVRHHARQRVERGDRAVPLGEPLDAQEGLRPAYFP